MKKGRLLFSALAVYSLFYALSRVLPVFVSRIIVLVTVAAIVLYLLSNAGHLWKVIKISRRADWFNPKKWWSVIYSYILEAIFPLHIIEQMTLRIYDPQCSKCMANGSCLYCGCDMRKVYTPSDECSEGNWSSMIMDEAVYRAFRRKFPVQISVKYGKDDDVDWAKIKASAVNNLEDTDDLFV